MKDARGHGSNARGTHAGAVEKVGSLKLHPNVVKAVQGNPAGFSVHPTKGTAPTSGYMVSIPGHTTIVNGAADENALREYANRNAAALREPGAHIGGWQHEGKTYLDVSHNIKGRGAAVAAGRKHNQIAIWDVKNSREINTGGTGA